MESRHYKTIKTRIPTQFSDTRFSEGTSQHLLLTDRNPQGGEKAMKLLEKQIKTGKGREIHTAAHGNPEKPRESGLGVLSLSKIIILTWKSQIFRSHQAGTSCSLLVFSVVTIESHPELRYYGIVSIKKGSLCRLLPTRQGCNYSLSSRTAKPRKYNYPNLCALECEKRSHKINIVFIPSLSAAVKTHQ